MRSSLASDKAQLVSLVAIACPFHDERLSLKLSLGLGHLGVEPTPHHGRHFRHKLFGRFIRVFRRPHRIQMELGSSSIMQKLAKPRELGLRMHLKGGNYWSCKFRPGGVSSVPSACRKRSGWPSEAHRLNGSRIECGSNVALRTGKTLTRLRLDGLNVHNSTSSRLHSPWLISSIQNAFLNSSISSRSPDASTATISKRISISSSR